MVKIHTNGNNARKTCLWSKSGYPAAQAMHTKQSGVVPVRQKLLLLIFPFQLCLSWIPKKKKKGKWSGLGNLANTEKNVCKHCTYCLCTRVSGHVRASTRVDVFFSTALWKRSERALPTLPSQDLTRWQWPRIPQLRSASVCLSWTRWKQHYQDLALPQALAFEGANPAVSLWDLFLVWEDLAKRKTFHFSVAFVA